MKNITRYFLLFLFVLSCYVPITYGQGVKATFSPTARFFPGFGSVVVGKSKDQIIRIYNDSSSTGDLNCTLNLPSGIPFSTSGSTNFSVSPGHTDSLIVHFVPTVTGSFRDTLLIAHNADTSSSLKDPLVYVLTGTGAPPDTFPKISVTSPGGFGTLVNYGSVAVGKTALKTIIIKNVSDTIRKLIGTVGTPYTSKYAIVSGGGAFSLDTGQSVTVTISFTPDTVANFLIDSLFIYSNVAPPTNKDKVTLLGTGVASSQYPKLTVGGVFGSINFRTDTIGHPPRTASFTITNTSDSARVLTGNISSPNSPFSIVSGGGAFSLDSGKSITVQLAFNATSIGTFYDTILITSNSDPVNPPIKIPLTGVGYTVTGPHLIIQPNVLNFGANKLGTSITNQIVKIKNNADTPQDTLTGFISAPTGTRFLIVSGGGAFSLNQGDSLSVAIQMKSDSIGLFNDSVVITSNSNDNAKHTTIHVTGNITAIGGVKTETSNFSNISALPNPFNERTAIHFNLANASSIHLKIFDMLGKKVFESPERIFPAGEGQIEWNASGLDNGSYLGILNTNTESRSIKIILSK